MNIFGSLNLSIFSRIQKYFSLKIFTYIHLYKFIIDTPIDLCIHLYVSLLLTIKHRDPYVYVSIVTYLYQSSYQSIYLSIPKYILPISCLNLSCRNTKQTKLNVSTYLWWVMKWSKVIIITNIRVNSTGQEVANLCCVSRLNIITIYFYY